MNGIIVLNKPVGKTSHDMVYFMRRLTGIKKIGHTGTLDPDASGVLPICIGSATKAADMLTLSDKRYRAEMTLGAETDTQDASGTVIEKRAVNVSEDEIRAAVSGFVGEIEQIPPMYSAIKKDGKKLYELARKGEEIERPARKITIFEINILDIDLKKNTVSLDVLCSKGTYIRTLCRDIGEKLGTLAYMSKLERTKTGMFTIEQARTPEELEALDDLESALISTDALFSDLPKIKLNEKQTKSIVNGVRMTYRGLDEGRRYRLYDENGRFLCVSKCADERLVLEKAFWT